MVDPSRVAELFNRFCEDAGELFDDGEPLPAAAYPVALDAACKRIAELEGPASSFAELRELLLEMLNTTLNTASEIAGAANVAIRVRDRRIAELEAERRWVELSERLPEDSSSILIRYLHGEVVVGFWGGDDWHDHDGVAPSHVTHWMPLPKPPEVSDGE